jgi:hypothetical protein
MPLRQTVVVFPAAVAGVRRLDLAGEGGRRYTPPLSSSTYNSSISGNGALAFALLRGPIVTYWHDRH